MTQTIKNWLTTTAGAGLAAAAVYFFAHEPTADGATTWATWKPLLIAMAFAFANGAWHAYQPQSGASAAAKAAAVKVAGSVLLLGTLVFGVGANCQAPVVSPQAQSAIQAAEQLGACIEGVYAADSQKVPAVTPVQIAIDEGLTCGADLQNLIDSFGTQPTKGQQDVIAAAQEHAAEFANAKLRHGK